MKKHLVVLILIATLLVAMFSFVACAGSVTCTDHQWEPMDLVDNGGYKSEVCAKCGATRRLCYPNSHTWGEFVYVDEDTHTATCEKCGIEKTFDHTFGDAIPEVHNTLTCLDCGAEVYTENSHAAVDGNGDGKCDVCLGDLTCSHTYDDGEVITPATCMTPGEIKLTCTKCGDVKVESINPTGHDWADWESNGDGTHSRVCANNDAHTETDDCVGEDATCLGDSNCTICGGIYQTAPDHTDEDNDGVCDDCETEVDDDPNHRGDDDCEHLNETVVTIPATCLAPGSIEHTCPDCGLVRIQPIEPLAHNWTDWESNGDGTHSRDCINGDTHSETEDCVGEDATCTEDSKCTVCDGIYQSATGHKDEDDNGTCDVCGAQISSEDTEPNPDGGTCDHTYDDGEVLVEASCEEEGEVLYTCTKCGDSYSLIFDPLGHLDMAGEFPDYHCDRVTENGEICDASTCEEHVLYNGSGYYHIDGTRTDGLQCLNCGVWVALGECNIIEVNYAPSCTRFGYVGLICAAENQTTFLDLDGFVDPTGHIDGDDDGYCDICETSNTRIENCTHTNFIYGDTEDTYTSELIGQFYDRYHNEWNFENLYFHWKECRDCHLLFDFESHSYDIFVTMPPCYSSEGYDVYRCVCGREDDSTRTNFTTLEGNYRTGHPDEDGDYECDNCGEFIDAIHECIDTNGDNHCDYCDDCRCEFVDDIYEMDKDHDHCCDNCGEGLDTCRDENNDGYCDYDAECGKHLDCEDTDGDYCCDACGRSIYPEHECIDENDNTCCDICNRHFNHIDEDLDCWCDYCWDQLCVDTDDDCRCDNCGYFGDVWENEFHVDDDHNHVCDKCGEEHPVWQGDSEHYHYSYCDLCSERFNYVEHSYVIVSQEPNCAYDGPVIPTIIKQCECGHIIRNGWAYNDVEHIDENGDYYCDVCGNCFCDHEYESEIIVESDCEEDGEIKFTCIYCGDSWTDWYSTGHDFYWQDNGDGTCSAECLNNPEHRIENNYHMDDDGDNYCDYCNANCAHEHVYETREEYRIDATCTYEGSYDSVTYCIYCDSEISRETIVIPATGVHNYHEVSGYNATCGQDGYRDMWCDGGCDDWYRETIPATGAHDYQEVSGSSPTCSQDGYRDMWCSGCSDSYQVTIPATGVHNYQEVSGSYPTCGQDGYRHMWCDGCGDWYQDIIPATGEHDYAWYNKVEPTCANAGHDVYYCVNCWTYDYRNEVPATGEHNYYWSKVGDAQHCQRCYNCSYESECEDCYGTEEYWHYATCLEDGYFAYRCDKCDYLYGVITEPATGIHSYDSWSDNGDGTHTGTCSMCWNATSEPEEHTFGSWMSNGNGTHVGYCDKCYTNSDSIQCSGGTATCTDYAWCSQCNMEYGEMLPHDYQYVEKVAPTCAYEGYEIYRCSCGAEEHRNPVPKTNEHNYYWYGTGESQHYGCCETCYESTEPEYCYGPEVDWHPATCSEDGFVEHNCEKCDYLYSVITEPATGIHSYDNWVNNGDGTHTGTCSMCWNATSEPEEHTFGYWMSYGNGTHVGYCDKCYTYGDPIDCSGGTATCTDYAWCSQCYTQYGEMLPHDYQYVERVAPTCAYEGYEIYMCSCGAEEHRNTVPTTDEHSLWWQSNYDGTHYAYCMNGCGYETEPEDCYGGTATCTQTAICEVCYNYYGETIPHNYQLNADYYNSCLSGEHARYVCTDCHDSYYTNLTPAEGHDVEIVIWSYPTCCTPGTAQVNCRTCGTSYVMNLPVDTENGHSWVPDHNWYNQWDDSCIFSIVFNGYCEYCGIYESYTLPPTLEHNIQELDRVEPTCEEDGYIYYNCTGCAECGKYETLPATGHQNVTEVVVPATCGFDGGKYEVCGDCGETINTLEIYPATGEHSWVTYEAQEPTCTDWGWTEYQECSVCYTTTEHEDYEPTWACVYDQQEIHNDYLVSDATCTSKAVYYYSCLCGACGWNETFEYGEEPVGHVDEDGNMVCEVCSGSLCDTCVDDDYNYRCDVCDLSVCVEHDWQFMLHDSTCTEDGEYYDYCYYCGDIRDYNVAEAFGHSYYCSYIDEVDATCMEAGWCTYYYTCYNCGDSYEETEVYPIKDHTYISSTLAPSCSYMGHWQGTCDYCGYTDSYDIPMIDHVTEIVVVEPSCYADGCTREVCTVCHQVVNEYDVVPQYGSHINENGDYNCDRCNVSLCTSHDYQQTYNTTHHYDECVNCGAIYPHTISAHYDYDNDNICDVCGACTHLFTTYTYDELNHTGVCDLCGAEVTSGHELVDKGTVEATCGMYGGMLYGCTVCDYTYIVKTTDATGEHANFTYDYNENLHWSICGDCGLIVSRERHNNKAEVLINSSCHYNGCESWYCTDENCGYVHLYENDRSCTEYEDDVCVDCGHCMYHSEWNDEDGDGICDRCGKCIEHTYVLEETFEPTCGEVGKSKYNCSVCGFVLYKDYVIPTGEHDFVPFALNDPTCSSQGYMIYECQACGKQVNRDFVPATGEHVDADNDYYCDNSYCKALLCDDHIDENSDIHCDKCGTSLCGDYHISDDTMYYDETHHWYVCATCGDRFEVSEHEYYMMEDLTPDCENSGIDIEGCHHCDYVRRTYYDALGHRDNNDDYVCDNCWTSFCIINGEEHIYKTIDDGFGHYSVCTKCGEGWIWSDHVDENDDGVCDECSGSTDYDCPHDAVHAEYVDEMTHEHYCDDCGEYMGWGSHDLDEDGWCWDCGEYI